MPEDARGTSKFPAARPHMIDRAKSGCKDGRPGGYLVRLTPPWPIIWQTRGWFACWLSQVGLVVPCCPQVQWPERLLVARRQHLEVLLLGVHVVALVVGLVDHVVDPVGVVQVDLVVVLEVKVLVVDQVEPIPSRLQSHWWCFCAVVPCHSRIHLFLLELVKRDVSSPRRRGH